MMDTATLLENQRLLNEVALPPVEAFKRIRIPLVRRIYPQLIANKITSVQPLLGPSGLVYYTRFRYSNRSTGWTVKPKRKKIWRDISEPWEPTSVGDF